MPVSGVGVPSRSRGALAATLLVVTAAGLVGVASPGRATTATVTIGEGLSPRTVRIAAGTRVTWRNADDDRHRIRSRTGPVELDSGNLDPGESWSFTFRTVGSYPYVDDREREETAYHGSVEVGAARTDPGEPGEPAPPPPDPRAPAPAPRAPATVTASIVDDAFSPRAITVASGGTVTWTNRDNRAHTVTARDGSFSSGILEPGARFSHTFRSPTTVSFYCQLHPDMTGTVTVPSSSGPPPPPKPDQPAPTPARPHPVAPRPDPPPDPPRDPAPDRRPAAPGRPASHTVAVSDSGFSPATLDARVGDTVTWVNRGALPHTVTAGAATFDGTLMPGESYRTVLRARGTVPYVCSFHPGMKGTIRIGAALPGVSVPPPSPPSPRSPQSSSLRSAVGHAVHAAAAGSAAAQATARPAAAGKPGRHQVVVTDTGFRPASLRARVGDTVVWVNRGRAPHTVTAADGSLDGVLAPGGTFSTVLRAQGTVDYVCVYHPGMTGRITVGPALPGVVLPAGSAAARPAGSAAAQPAVHPAGHAATAATGAERHTVRVDDRGYEPASLHVRAGDTVEWVNVGRAPHTVTAVSGAFNGQLAPGGRFSWVAEVAEAGGTVDYVCAYHPNMVGSITVHAADATSVPGQAATTDEATSVPAQAATADQAPDATAPVSLSRAASLGSGWLLLVAFLAGLQLRARRAPAPKGAPS